MGEAESRLSFICLCKVTRLFVTVLCKSRFEVHILDYFYSRLICYYKPSKDKGLVDLFVFIK